LIISSSGLRRRLLAAGSAVRNFRAILKQSMDEAPYASGHADDVIE
jgi:hypothetical protein